MTTATSSCDTIIFFINNIRMTPLFQLGFISIHTEEVIDDSPSNHQLKMKCLLIIKVDYKEYKTR